MSRISEAIKNDHREIESYYDRIINAKDDDEKTRYQNQFTWELARHAHGEELVVYPAFEKKLSNGKSMADKDRDEHQVVRTIASFFFLFLIILVDRINTYGVKKGQGKVEKVPEPQSIRS